MIVSKAAARRAINDPASLSTLPVELLQAIARHMTVWEANHLSITSNAMKRVLAPMYRYYYERDFGENFPDNTGGLPPSSVYRHRLQIQNALAKFLNTIYDRLNVGFEEFPTFDEVYKFIREHGTMVINLEFWAVGPFDINIPITLNVDELAYQRQRFEEFMKIQGLQCASYVRSLLDKGSIRFTPGDIEYVVEEWQNLNVFFTTVDRSHQLFDFEGALIDILSDVLSQFDDFSVNEESEEEESSDDSSEDDLESDESVTL